MDIRIKIPTKYTAKIIIKFMIYFVCFERLLESIGLPHSIVFILDGCNILLLLSLLYGKQVNCIFSNRMVKIHLFVFFIALVVSFSNGVKPILILWSLRNLLRFYIFFGACVAFLTPSDVAKIMASFEKIFWCNFFVLLFEYGVGYRADYLGGIFGTATGANAYSNIFIIIVCTYISVRFFEKKENIIKLMSIMIASFLFAILTETKILFFEIAFLLFLIIVIVSIIEGKYRILLKGAIMAMFVVILIILGAKKLAELYPSLSNSGMLSIEGLKYILTRESGYSGSGDLNRLTAITSINKLNEFEGFETRLFGLGLGSTEYSSSVISLQSCFYQKYSYLHYYWFSHAWMYLECGYVGILGYLVGFFINIQMCIKNIKKTHSFHGDSTFFVLGSVFSLLTLMLCVYNQSMRLECAYLVYFIFSVSYIKEKGLNVCNKSTS